MTKIVEKPIVTISGRKNLFKSNLHHRIVQDLPQEGVEWRRRLDSNTKSVYIDVDFVDYDVDEVERSSERLKRLSLGENLATPLQDQSVAKIDDYGNKESATQTTTTTTDPQGLDVSKSSLEVDIINDECLSRDDSIARLSSDKSPQVVFKKMIDLEQSAPSSPSPNTSQDNDISQVFFNQKLLGRPILHTYWADKSDFENENQKSQFDEWIGKVQASTCTEWAIIIVEDGDFKAQLNTALFKSKLQSSASQANLSSSSLSSFSQSSFLDRMKKSLSTIFQSDSNSDRWLTLVNQERISKDNKAQESYVNFLKKFRNIIMASFSKQIELFEEQLRVQREMRTEKKWDFFSYFFMQEELAFAFEFLTLFDEALVQYDFLDALFTEYISSPNFNCNQEPLYDKWTNFSTWPALCLDMNNEHSNILIKRISEKEASLLEFRNYLFAKRCDLMLMQNQPWRVAASTSVFINTCIREHRCLKIKTPSGSLKCWSFVSSLEVLQKCECYSCTSTMENYSFHTVDIWNNARQNLADLGSMLHRMPGSKFTENEKGAIEKLLAGLGEDPHKGTSYQGNEISPQARLKDALSGSEQFSKHLIEISELTLGTYKHIGRKRHALLVGKKLADFYLAQGNPSSAIQFLNDLERQLIIENWTPLLVDVRKSISYCNSILNNDECNQLGTAEGVAV